MAWQRFSQRISQDAGLPEAKFGIDADNFPCPIEFVDCKHPNLWVEKGVIWQLPNLLVGFTSYSAATGFFSSVKGLGYESAPSSWYEGTPFSASDFPILHFGKKDVEIVGCILIWPSLNTMPYAKTFSGIQFDMILYSWWYNF